MGTFLDQLAWLLAGGLGSGGNGAITFKNDRGQNSIIKRATLLSTLGSLHLYRSLKLGGSSSNFSEITCTVGVGVMGMTKETGCFDIGLLLLLTVATINESKQLAAWTTCNFLLIFLKNVTDI